MSAIKTHEFFTVVSGDQVDFENEDGTHKLQVKTMMIPRANPTTCQLFTEKENTGSLSSRETRVYHGSIVSFSTGDSPTRKFQVKAKVGDAFKELNLQTVKSHNSECCIC